MQIIEIPGGTIQRVKLENVPRPPTTGYLAWYKIAGRWQMLYPGTREARPSENALSGTFDTVSDVENSVRKAFSDVSQLEVRVMKVELV